jgi:hypothetical protein
MDQVTRCSFRAALKGLSEEGRWCRRQINKASRERRDAWWGTKRRLGSKARVTLLAYGMLRDRPCAAIEFRKEPMPASEAEWLGQGIAAVVRLYGSYDDRYRWREEAAIRQWLRTGPTEALLSAHEAAERASRQRREEARARAAERRLEAERHMAGNNAEKPSQRGGLIEGLIKIAAAVMGD